MSENISIAVIVYELQKRVKEKKMTLDIMQNFYCTFEGHLLGITD